MYLTILIAIIVLPISFYELINYPHNIVRFVLISIISIIWIISNFKKKLSLPSKSITILLSLIISETIGKEVIHFEAPNAKLVPQQMTTFINWYNSTTPDLDLVLKAGIAHLWFLTIHPFENGNSRIAYALTDKLLAKADNSDLRFYSLSAQLELNKKDYYQILGNTQTVGKTVKENPLYITDWLSWFLDSLLKSLSLAENNLESVLEKANFWQKHQNTNFNTRQQFMIKKFFNDFHGKLNTSKWAEMVKTSHDSALRDIKDLVKKGVLEKEKAGGRSTNYSLIL